MSRSVEFRSSESAKHVSERYQKMRWYLEDLMAPELEKKRIEKNIDYIEVFGHPPAEWGFPPEHVSEAAKEAFHPTADLTRKIRSEVLEAIRERLLKVNKVERDPKKGEILTTLATSGALHLAIHTLVNPGDQVLMFTPSFFFTKQVEYTGGVPLYVPLKEEDNYRYDSEALAQRVDPRRTKVIIVCNPVNPTGYIPTRQDLEDVAEIAEKYDLLVVEDAIYDQLIYAGERYAGSIAQFIPERTVICWSASKSMAMSPFRIGYLAAPEGIASTANKLKKTEYLSTPVVCEAALLAALTGPQGWIKQVVARWQECRDLFYNGLTKIDGISCVKPRSSSFIYPNISGTGLDDMMFYRHLFVNGLEAWPAWLFKDSRHENVRIELGAPTPQVIKEWLDRLNALLEKL